MSYYIGLIGNVEKEDMEQVYILAEKALALQGELEDKDFDDSVYLVCRLVSNNVSRAAYKLSRASDFKIVGIGTEEDKQIPSSQKLPDAEHFRYVPIVMDKRYEQTVDEEIARNSDILLVFETTSVNHSLPILTPEDIEVYDTEK